METQNETVRKVLLLYQARHPGLEILDAAMDEKDPDVVHVIAAGRKAKLLYNRSKNDILVLDEDVYIKQAQPAPQEQPQKTVEEKSKGVLSGLAAMVLTVAYAIYLLDYFAKLGIDDLSNYVALALVTPHMVCVILASCFSLVGFFGRHRWAMLTSGILMAVSAALFPTYLTMVVFQSIMFFVSYARMEKKIIIAHP